MSSLDFPSLVKDISSMKYFQPLAIKLAGEIPKDLVTIPRFEIKAHLPNDFWIVGIVMEIALEAIASLGLLILRGGLVICLEVIILADKTLASIADRFLALISHVNKKLINTARAVYVIFASLISKKLGEPNLASGDGTCVICLDDIAMADSVKRPGCTEVCQTAQRIHENCLKEWLRTKNKCPNCQSANPLKGDGTYFGDFPWNELERMNQDEFLRNLRNKKVTFKVENIRLSNWKKYTLTFRDEVDPVIIYFGGPDLLFPSPQYVRTNFVPRMNRAIPIPPLQNRNIAPIVEPFLQGGRLQVVKDLCSIFAGVFVVGAVCGLPLEGCLVCSVSMLVYAIKEEYSLRNPVGRAVRV